MFRVRRGYVPRLHTSITSFVGYVMLRVFLTYTYVVVCILIWSYTHDQHIYVYVNSYYVCNITGLNVVLFGERILGSVLSFLWEWRSHHPFSTSFFFVVILVGHLDFVIYNNKTHIATLILWAFGLDPLHRRLPIWHTHPTSLPRYMVTMSPWDHHYERHS